RARASVCRLSQAGVFMLYGARLTSFCSGPTSAQGEALVASSSGSFKADQDFALLLDARSVAPRMAAGVRHSWDSSSVWTLRVQRGTVRCQIPSHRKKGPLMNRSLLCAVSIVTLVAMAPAQVLLSEPFNNNNAGWTLDPTW